MPYIGLLRLRGMQHTQEELTSAARSNSLPAYLVELALACQAIMGHQDLIMIAVLADGAG